MRCERTIAACAPLVITPSGVSIHATDYRAGRSATSDLVLTLPRLSTANVYPWTWTGVGAQPTTGHETEINGCAWLRFNNGITAGNGNARAQLDTWYVGWPVIEGGAIATAGAPGVEGITLSGTLHPDPPGEPADSSDSADE